MEPGVPCALDGDPYRVVEVSCCDFVVADQAGEDRQSGGVSRGPRVRAPGGRAQVPARARVGVPVRPALAAEESPVELVEDAVRPVDDEDVAIAIAVRAALD